MSTREIVLACSGLATISLPVVPWVVLWFLQRNALPRPAEESDKLKPPKVIEQRYRMPRLAGVVSSLAMLAMAMVPTLLLAAFSDESVPLGLVYVMTAVVGAMGALFSFMPWTMKEVVAGGPLLKLAEFGKLTRLSDRVEVAVGLESVPTELRQRFRRHVAEVNNVPQDDITLRCVVFVSKDGWTIDHVQVVEESRSNWVPPKKFQLAPLYNFDETEELVAKLRCYHRDIIEEQRKRDRNVVGVAGSAPCDPA